MEKMKIMGVDFRAIAAISGAGQQHGSVYWSADAEACLSSLDYKQPLSTQLCPIAFSLPNAPIWQDSSTTKDCQNLEEFIGGPQVLTDITGSRAYERFTGPQIAKIRRVNPKAYESTSQISLVSSFMASLFLGKIAPIEVSDASGMNLMNVLTCKWDHRLLETCGGPSLRSKLGPEPVLGASVIGKINDWWVKRWGFDPECIVVPFTGDNPATVVALSGPGDAILSLGTSTTFLLSIPPSNTPPKRFTTSHLLSHPATPNAQIAMLCYKNGALAREEIRDIYAQGDWSRFNALIEESPAGNNGHMGLYFPLPEIIPQNVVGEYLFSTTSGTPLRVDAIPAEAHPRAILESQFLSIRSRIATILPVEAPHLQRLLVTGGSSTNRTIQQLAADLFGMKVYVAEGPGSKEAAGMGGAMLARYAWLKKNGGTGLFEHMSIGEVRMRCVAEPGGEVAKVYDELVGVYKACEEDVVTKYEGQASF
jgi:xylulokinase